MKLGTRFSPFFTLSTEEELIPDSTEAKKLAAEIAEKTFYSAGLTEHIKLEMYKSQCRKPEASARRSRFSTTTALEREPSLSNEAIRRA